MSSNTFVGNSESDGTEFSPVPPPPPPPPVPGQVPTLRINTVEASIPRRSLPNINNNNSYEPPAAIQNAMMTKDKKPFTYTPGMGGKLDLSQIRSPRMARRVAKNANNEGIEGPPKSSLAVESRPISTAPNLYVQPQVAVPVFPANVPLQQSSNRTSSAPVGRVLSNASDRAVEIQKPLTRVETKSMTQVISPQSTPPETPTTPPQVILAKAPTPWLQNKNKTQEELPEWAKRPNVNKSSNSTSPESPNAPIAQIPINQAQPQVQQTIQLQQTPLTRQHQPQPPPRQQSLPQERVIPLRIEDRPSVFSVKHEPGHHQFKQQTQSSPHHQQRWGNSTSPQTLIQPQSSQFTNQNHHQQQQQSPRPQSSGGGTYIVPIMIESSNNDPSVTSYNQQPQQIQPKSQPIQNQSPRVIVQRGSGTPQIQQQGEPGPLQSRSFRVLQKITDTDSPDDTEGEQLRKLQLTEDDKVLMKKFKEQVDGDGTYLHQDEDPRYRGAAIPSRAFRFLQNMTESGDVTATANAPRTSNAINKRQNRNSRTFEETQANLPASEQQAPEPKKYTGSAIPSRSFRILQAMTSPESIAKQEENREAVATRNESSMQPIDHQQTLFLSSPSSNDNSSGSLAPSKFQRAQTSQMQQLPHTIWRYPEDNCLWFYYPIDSSSSSTNHFHKISSYENCVCCTVHHNHHHHHLQDGNACAYYQPFCDQHFLAAATISSPNGVVSSSSSSSSSSNETVAAVHAAALSKCMEKSSSSSNEEASTMVSSNELPLDDSGISSASISSRLVDTRGASMIMLPGSVACFVPALIRHQSPNDSFGYDRNCNDCLEGRVTGVPTIFRCPAMFVERSMTPGEGYHGSGGRNVWACQDHRAMERGPPPWSDNNENVTCVDKKKEEIFGGEETAGWNLDGSIGNQDNSFGRQREDTLIRKEDINVSGTCSAVVLEKKVDVSNSEWSRKRVEEKEDDAERSGRDVASNSLKKHDASIPKWSRNGVAGKEDDAERSGRDVASNSLKKHDVSIPKWRRDGVAGKEDDAERSGRNIDVNTIDQESKIGWNRIDNASKNLNDLEPSIPMNILHSNDSSVFDTTNINEVSASQAEDDYSEDDNDTKSDSGSDSTSTESSIDTKQIFADPATNTESDSDDSDSYLAYSTGFNSQNKLIRETNGNLSLNNNEKKYRKLENTTTVDDDTFNDKSDRLNFTDCESCAEEDDALEEETKLRETEEIASNRLSVIEEDNEQNKIDADGWQNVPVEPPDHSDTISFNFPLRFPFSIAKNDRDVIIDNSDVKNEDNLRTEDTNDVFSNLKVIEDTSDSFNLTLPKIVSKEAKEDDFYVCETKIEEYLNSKEKKIKEDDALKSLNEVEEEEINGASNDDDCIDFWETLKSGNESPVLIFNSRKKLEKEEIDEKEEIEKIEENLEIDEIDEKEEIEEKEEKEEIEEIEEMSKENEKLAPNDHSNPLFELTEATREDNEEETTSVRSNIEITKKLLSVENSRDETDDEDSGVTSDMSRLISEVDTDSECGNSKKINSYKRTQTHSRLFRLLNREDDDQVDEEMKNSSMKNERLALPLKNSGFNYDECHQCSNYSSGLTSPDFSTFCDAPWRQIRNDDHSCVCRNIVENSQSPSGSLNDEDCSKNRGDPYFENWKKSINEDTRQDEKAISSFGTLNVAENCGFDNWRFRRNVLCPRIKSTKNVPRAVRNNRNAKPILSISSISKTLEK